MLLRQLFANSKKVLRTLMSSVVTVLVLVEGEEGV